MILDEARHNGIKRNLTDFPDTFFPCNIFSERQSHMYIDSHVHLDNIYRAAPERIQWLREQECIPVSWSFAEKIEQKNDLEHYSYNFV